MKDYSPEINAALKRVAELALEHAKQVVPVRTGRLKNSLHITEVYNRAYGSSKYIVGTNVYYAKFVEFGRINAKPRSFLAPAAEYARSRAADVFAVYLGGHPK